MKYRHIFFDLDHTLWDFDANAKATLIEVYDQFKLSNRNIPIFKNSTLLICIIMPSFGIAIIKDLFLQKN